MLWKTYVRATKWPFGKRFQNAEVPQMHLEKYVGFEYVERNEVSVTEDEARVPRKEKYKSSGGGKKRPSEGELTPN